MNFKNLCACSIAALGVAFAPNGKAIAADKATWDKVFAKSDKVEVKKVSFTNRFGIDLAGDLYEPKDKNAINGSAIAISGPFAVDYLLTLPQVDKNKIGIIGICGFGGFGLNAAAQDTRIKATVASTMYDMTRVSSKGYNDVMSEEDLYKLREDLNNQRTKDYKAGTFAKAPGLPEKLTGEEPLFVKEYFEYYKTPRGFHPRSINSNGNWNTTSALSLITQPILAYSDTIKNAVLVVHGEKAHSRYFSEDAFKKLKGDNKELYIVPDANHVDLYDNMSKIPFDKIEQFFKKNLK